MLITVLQTINFILLISALGFWVVMGTIIMIPSKAEREEWKRLTSR